MKNTLSLVSLYTFLVCACASAADKDVKLFLLAGQSNMDGCGSWNELPENPQALPENVRIWDNRETKWVAIGEDTTAIARKKQFGPELAFAHRLAKAYPDHDIALVKTSAGGTKLQNHWLPGKSMYERFTKNYQNAAADLGKAGKKCDIAGMLWMQGESDSETLEMANAYEENLKAMIRDVRQKTGRKHLPVVMGRISSSLLKKTPWNFDHAPVVQKAQEAVAAGDPDTYLINTDKLTTLKDNTHFDTKGQMKLGDDMAARMLEALAKDKQVGASAGKPNIILIMADDMGVECLSAYGGESHQTPHLDALAASGVRFTNAHSQPICTPSRVQIMTGIHNNRNYVRFGVLDPQAVTFGNLLREAGYKTAIAGKWQLEGGFEGPVRFGFDRYCLWQLTRKPSRYPNPGLEIDGKEMDFKNGEFGPDIVSDYVCKFMEETKDGPFFVYYPMIMPHWPFVPTPDHPDYDPKMWRDAKNEPGGFRSSKYWPAMVSHTDKMVGKVVTKLDELGIRDNTLIIWTGDNGTYDKLSTRFRGRDYKGGKGGTKDNGTHVGFITSWPAVIKPGQTSEALVDFTDVLPTLTEVAGAKTPDLVDGVSLAPLFRGEPRRKDFIYCWYSRDGLRDKASEHVRDACHKLYASGRFFDVVADPDEKNNLAAAGITEDLRDTHTRLKAALDRHLAITQVADPVLTKRRGELNRSR